jgi:naphtho-gamma-pyrone polyketide synthase
MDVHLYLFGDVSGDVETRLDRLLRLADEPLLRHFFDGAYQALRSEVSQLPPSQREQFQPFSSVRDLLYLQRAASLHPVLRGALVTIFHLGSYIRWVP